MDILGVNEFGMIRAVIDGVTTWVPDDMDNGDRQRIWDEWEMGPADKETGERVRVNTIPSFESPPLPMPELTSRQFWLAALEAGVTKEGLINDVNSAFSGSDLDYYLIEITESTSFSRLNPMVDILASMNGFSSSQIDDLWRRAASI